MMKRMWIAMALFLVPTAAQADAIFGCWTNGTERLVIEATKITTPTGANPPAKIDRHSAQYTAPPNERDAGKTLTFRQINENEVARTVGKAGSSDSREVWTVCQQVTS